MDSNRHFINVRELMDLAIRFEEDSIRYYRDMRDRTENRKALSLLKVLEKQEAEHRDTLRNFKLGPGPYAMLQYGPDFSLTMPVVEQDTPGLMELVDVAIEREVLSVRIYRHTADQVFGDLAQLLERLAGFEEEHERKLKNLREYLISGG